MSDLMSNNNEQSNYIKSFFQIIIPFIFKGVGGTQNYHPPAY